MARLTVGMPVRNSERFLTETLDSILGQSFSDFRLFISDNASTGMTVGAISVVKNCRVVSNGTTGVSLGNSSNPPGRLTCGPPHPQIGRAPVRKRDEAGTWPASPVVGVVNAGQRAWRRRVDQRPALVSGRLSGGRCRRSKTAA